MRCEGYMLVTRDIEASKAFYRDILGLEVEHDIGAHVIFKEGFSLLLERDWLSFAELPQAAVAYGHKSGQLVFEVDDIEAFLRRVEQLPEHRFLHRTKEHHWGRRAVRLYDPDGHVTEVGESMKVVIKRFLGQGMTPEETAARSEFPLAYVLLCRAEMDTEQSCATGPFRTPD